MTVVVALGRSNRGQLGLDDAQRKKKEASVAPTVAFQALGNGPNERVVMVACGADFSLLLLKSGLVWSSGCNATGQLGNTAAGAFSARPVPVKELLEVLKISCGSHHASAVNQAGDAFMWGLNDSGQLGLGHRKPCPEPARLCEPALADQAMVDMAASASAVPGPQDDTIPARPRDADNLRRTLCHPRGSWPEFVAGMEDRMYGWREIACGLQHTIATFRSRDQRELHVLSCGSGAAGCLGNGGTADLTSPLELLEVRVRTLDVIQVAAGAYHSVILCRDSSVWTFGFSSDGRLGFGPDLAAGLCLPRRAPSEHGMRQSQSAGLLRPVGAPTPARPASRAAAPRGQFRTCLPRRVDALNGVPVVHVACGSSHTVALAADGDVWGWGGAVWGQLGGSKQQVGTPQPIAALCQRGVVGLVCGAFHTAALNDHGQLLLLGMNEEGQCGPDALGGGLRGGIVKRSDACVRAPRVVHAAQGVSGVGCGDGHTIAIANVGPEAAGVEGEDELDELALPSTMRRLPSMSKSPSGGLFKQPRLKFSRSLPVIQPVDEAGGLAGIEERFASAVRVPKGAHAGHHQASAPTLGAAALAARLSSSRQGFGLHSRGSLREAVERHPAAQRTVPLGSSSSVLSELARSEADETPRRRGLRDEAAHSAVLRSYAAESALKAYVTDHSVVSPDLRQRHKFVFGSSLAKELPA